MSYHYKQCENATSEEIQKLIDTYKEQYARAQQNRNEAVARGDSATASKYDVEVRDLEIALENLSKDLNKKRKEKANAFNAKQDKSEAKKQIEDLIRQLLAIVQIL